MARKPPSLVAFAAARSVGGRVCGTCTLVPREVRDEIAAVRRELPPVSWPTISEWMEAHHNIALNPNAIRAHFKAGHDKEAA